MRIIYLIQGKLENVEKFSYLQSNGNSLLTLTYDFDFEREINWLGNIFFPNSTFSQGRNRLYQIVNQLKLSFDYLVYLDDDATFSDPQWHNKFHFFLSKYRPKFAVPLSDSIKNSKRYIPTLSVEHPRAFDQIVQAFHFSIIPDHGIVPLEENYDHLSWWYCCEINQLLVLKKHISRSLQCNDILVFNKNHHIDNPENSPKSIYRGGINREILNDIFLKNYKLNLLKNIIFKAKVFFYSRIMSRFISNRD